jgi:nicotinamidase-related amidase
MEMLEHHKAISQFSLVTEMTEPAVATAAVGIDAASAVHAAPIDPGYPCSTWPEMKLDLARTALVVIDPHTDLLSPNGATWSALGGGWAERAMVRNLGRLFNASKCAGIAIAISLTAEGFGRSGFMPELKGYIEDRNTIVCSPHKRYSPLPRVNDVGLQLRRQRVGQVILAGLIANLRLESHLRDFVGQGFEVALVRDAIAGPQLPEGDGYLSALINFRRVANALWTTDQAVEALRAEHQSQPNAKEYAR